MGRTKAETMFPAQLVSELFNLVQGKSSIAKMVGSKPIAFNGNTQFTFSMDTGVAVVGEAAQKPAQNITVAPVTIRPVKVVYQARVTEEFDYATEEARIDYLRAFAEGYSRKLAEGLDLMIMHGTNPQAGTASTVIGNNHLDYVIGNYSTGANVVEYDSDDPADAQVEDALAKVDAPNGIILGKTVREAISKQTATGGTRLYPEFAWGATPKTLSGMKLDTNTTVEANSASARAYVGDWNALRWGFAKEIPLEIIRYGDPDGQGDLKRTNEIVLRSEAYIGWGILNPASFAMLAVDPS